MLASVLALGIFVVAFWFIATERANKVKTVLVAAGLMTVLGPIPGDRVFFSEHEGIDWNVIFLLLGMMVIVGVIKQTGVFDFLAIWAAKRSHGKPYRLMVMLMLITAIASPVLDNVTVILLVAPVTLVICDRLRIAAQPYLIAEVLASNIGGAATLIGDPPNIIIGSRAGLTFNDFLVHMAPAVVVIFALFVVFTRFLFHADLRGDAVHLDEVMALQERRAIRDTRLLKRTLAVPRWSSLDSRFIRCCMSRRRSSLWWGLGRCCWSPMSMSPRCSRRWSGQRWCSSWGCSRWSRASCTPVSSEHSAPLRSPPLATTTSSRPPRCSLGRRLSERSSTTFRTPRR